jgi:hypothetical protein
MTKETSMIGKKLILFEKKIEPNHIPRNSVVWLVHARVEVTSFR